MSDDVLVQVISATLKAKIAEVARCEADLAAQRVKDQIYGLVSEVTLKVMEYVEFERNGSTLKIIVNMPKEEIKP